MSVKVHFLHSHLDKFLDNCSNVSNEQREQFHQNIKTMEERYQGWWEKQMIAGYCCSIKRDLHNVEHGRQSRKKFFYHSSYVYEGYISAVSLLNDLMKTIVGLGIFNRVILKDLGPDCYCEIIVKIVFLNSKPIFVGLNMN